MIWLHNFWNMLFGNEELLEYVPPLYSVDGSYNICNLLFLTGRDGSIENIN